MPYQTALALKNDITKALQGYCQTPRDFVFFTLPPKHHGSAEKLLEDKSDECETKDGLMKKLVALYKEASKGKSIKLAVALARVIAKELDVPNYIVEQYHQIRKSLLDIWNFDNKYNYASNLYVFSVLEISNVKKRWCLYMKDVEGDKIQGYLCLMNSTEGTGGNRPLERWDLTLVDPIMVACNASKIFQDEAYKEKIIVNGKNKFSDFKARVKDMACNHDTVFREECELQSVTDGSHSQVSRRLSCP